MKLDPTAIGVIGALIPFLTALTVHRNAKAGYWPAVKAILAIVAAVGVSIQQHGGIVSKQTVVTAALTFIVAHVTDWGVLHQTGAWSWLLGALGNFGLGNPHFAIGGVAKWPGITLVGESDSSAPRVGDGDSRAASMAAHPSMNFSFHPGAVESLITRALQLNRPDALNLLNHVAGSLGLESVHGTAVGLIAKNNDGSLDVRDHVSGAELFGAPIPADLPVEALATSTPTFLNPVPGEPPALWNENAAGVAANAEAAAPQGV